MNVRNCRKCGRLFNYVSGPPICVACKEAMEARFQDVKKYVQDHATASVHEVAEECEVEIAQINQWIREERLVFSDDSPMGIPCEMCGATIKTGRFCESCKSSMAHNLESVIPKKQKPDPVVSKDPKANPKMHFLDKMQ